MKYEMHLNSYNQFNHNGMKTAYSGTNDTEQG